MENSMRKYFGMVCGLTIALGLTALCPIPAARADKPVSIEKELLGIRVLQTYKQVLARYGAPTYIFKLGEPLLLLDARNLKGDITGGVIGVDNGGSGAGNAGGSPGGPGGFAGKGGGGGAPGSFGGRGGGAPGSFGGGNQYAQASRQGGGGAPGSFGGGPGAPGNLGGGQGSLAGAGASSGGGSGGAQAGSEQTFGESGGYIWVYHYPKQELAYVFAFNHDGRIEAIFERGRSGGQKTTRGVGLGDSIDAVYRAYGWTDGVKEERDGMISFYYNDKYHAQFVTVKNKVIGIVVALRETQKLSFLGGGNGSGGGGGRAGGGGAPGSFGGGAGAKGALRGAGGGPGGPGGPGGKLD